MTNKKKNNIKDLFDNILIYNLYILIIGAIFFIVSVLLSINGNSYTYTLFLKLWYPIFIPVLSLFFTSILLEVLVARFIGNKQK